MKIAIVDDHPLFAEGLRSFLLNVKGRNKVVTYNSGTECLKKVSRIDLPDIFFMDVMMPGISGIETIRELKRKYPDVKIIAITSLVDIQYLEALVSVEVDSLLLKDSSIEEMEYAVKQTIKGVHYFSPKVSIILTKESFRKTTDQSIALEFITEREMDVLKLLCTGVNRSKTADILGVSEKTVDKHKENLLLKTSSENLVQLVLFGIKNRVIEIM